MTHQLKCLAGAAGAGGRVLPLYASVTYARYGGPPTRPTANTLLDSLMPEYEVR